MLCYVKGKNTFFSPRGKRSGVETVTHCVGQIEDVKIFDFFPMCSQMTSHFRLLDCILGVSCKVTVEFIQFVHFSLLSDKVCSKCSANHSHSRSLCSRHSQLYVILLQSSKFYEGSCPLSQSRLTLSLQADLQDCGAAEFYRQFYYISQHPHVRLTFCFESQHRRIERDLQRSPGLSCSFFR